MINPSHLAKGALAGSYNSGGDCSSPTDAFVTSATYYFGLEVLNGGQAIFCVQTRDQGESGACDLTTAPGCSSVTGVSDTVMQGKSILF